MSGYRTLRVSDETAFDLTRALWMSDQLNAREGLRPAKPEAQQAEALGRVIREWSAMVVSQVAHAPGFDQLCRADWRCSCGSSGLNKGGLVVTSRGVLCRGCLETPP